MDYHYKIFVTNQSCSISNIDTYLLQVAGLYK